MTVLFVVLAASYDLAARTAHLSEGLAAVRATEPATLAALYDNLRALERGGCRSDLAGVRAECLIAAAKRRCRDQATSCAAAADVVIGAVLAEGRLISEAERLALSRRHRDLRRELRREIGRRQAALAVGLHVAARQTCRAGDDACLARQIDAYCSSAGDARELSWQHCAATLVWFIGAGAEL